MNFIIIALPALLICLIMKYYYKHEISGKEFCIHFAAACVSIALMMGLTYASLYASMIDTEILKGKVLSKSREVEICTQNSSCKNYHWKERCSYYTDSKGKRQKSCESYKVFDYSYEVDWHVRSSVGSNTIERINAQGTLMPPRWANIRLGDPASAESNYINYLLGNKDSLFYQQQYEKEFTAEYKKKLPEYPEVYDYYRVDHVLNLTKADSTGYNDYINLALRDMGAAKQVNIVMVMYPASDLNFVKALTAKWRGGKKNDVVMFIGLDDENTVSNFSSTSFGQGMQNELLHSTMKMDAMTEKMSPVLVQQLVKDVNEHFKRLPNKEFEYLKYKLEPSLWVVILCSILAAAISIGVGLYMVRNDL